MIVCPQGGTIRHRLRDKTFLLIKEGDLYEKYYFAGRSSTGRLHLEDIIFGS